LCTANETRHLYVTMHREKRWGKCGDVHIRKCDAVSRGYTWNCTYCPRVFLPIMSGQRPEQKDTLRSVLGENIWQFSVGCDMPPSLTTEPLQLYLTRLWACLKFSGSNYRNISESWCALKDSEVSTWIDWLSKNTNISLSTAVVVAEIRTGHNSQLLSLDPASTAKVRPCYGPRHLRMYVPVRRLTST
jgi:hypothetical protein